MSQSQITSSNDKLHSFETVSTNPHRWQCKCLPPLSLQIPMSNIEIALCLGKVHVHVDLVCTICVELGNFPLQDACIQCSVAINLPVFCYKRQFIFCCCAPTVNILEGVSKANTPLSFLIYPLRQLKVWAVSLQKIFSCHLWSQTYFLSQKDLSFHILPAWKISMCKLTHPWRSSQLWREYKILWEEGIF